MLPKLKYNTLYHCIPLPCYSCNQAFHLHCQQIISTFVTTNVTYMNTRLKQFLAAENISQAQFADSINVVRASVSHVLAGRNNPSYDFIKAIMDKYPQLNIEWLILGKGKMYKEMNTAPSREAPLKEDLEPGLLFPGFAGDAEELTTIEADIPLLMDEPLPNIQISNEINTSRTPQQTIVRQRKVSKIIVLFDDGSYQEM